MGGEPGQEAEANSKVQKWCPNRSEKGEELNYVKKPTKQKKEIYTGGEGRQRQLKGD